MSRSLRGLSLVMVVAAVTGCGALGGSATPSPTPGAGRTPLAAGTYTSSAFKPPVTVTLPERWVIAGDAPTQFTLQPAETDIVGIHLFRAPLPASQDPACPSTAEANVGTSAADLVAWIQARPGLVVSDPIPVRIGGYSGQQIDVAIKDGWTTSCPYADGVPTVPLFVNLDADFRWTIAGQERLRLDILDVPGDGTVVVDIDDFDGTIFSDLLREATPIVDSLQFGLP